MKLSLKIFACILALTLSCGAITVSAETAQIEPEIDATEKVINLGEAVEPLGAPSTTILSGAIYNIVSAKSGKYLNVHYGNDSNGTNVYQWTADGSDEQQFRVVYDSATASYKIYAMCSSNGTNRVLDIERNGAAVSAGQNVEIWTPVDPTAQNWTITNMGNGYFKISPKANTALALTVYGTSNGTSGGRTSTSAGNVYISTYDTYISQLWTFEEVEPEEPYGRLEAIYGNTIVGYAWRSDLPNTPIFVKVYITDSYGNNVTGSPFTVEANIYRDYLQTAGYGNGVHGFEVYFDWDSVPEDVYTIEAFAISASGGTVGLVASPRTVDTRPHITISNYIDQGYQVRFGGYSDVLTYNSIVGAKLESIFGLVVSSNYISHTSAADTCKINTYGSVSSSNLASSCTHSSTHLTTTALRDVMGNGTNTNSRVLWTGHILTGNPRSNSNSTRNSVVITPYHTTTGSSYTNKSDSDVRQESIFTLMHETSHQIGAPDHYCYDEDAPYCENDYCDEHVYGMDDPRQCIMSYRYDIEAENESTLYCSSCLAIINAHIADHHD
ncbi:MAG: RICIN domain-containing protein [Clostridia bacterium]|nr:RICIN domain-containing protein [Clostridia bacterium]